MKNLKSKFMPMKSDYLETFVENTKRRYFPSFLYYLGKRKKISLINAYRIYREFEKKTKRSYDLFKSRKKSETLAILGSGSSINEISAEEFSFIKKIDSLVLNFWCYHWFTPDFYMFENITESEEPNWFKLMRKRANDYRRTLFLANIRGIYLNKGSFAEFIVKFPSVIVNNIYPFYVRHVAVYKNSNFGNRGIEKNLSKSRLPCGPYIGLRASLAIALNFAYAMGYRKVILYGIDLKNSGYFWSDYTWIKPHIRTNKNRNFNEAHETAREDIYKGIHSYIYFLREEIFNPEGREIFVANKKSLLYPTIPLFIYKEHFNKVNYEDIK